MAQQRIKSAIKASAAIIIGTLILGGCFVDRPAYDDMSTEEIFQEVEICSRIKSTSEITEIWLYRENDRDLAIRQHQSDCKDTHYEVDGQLHRYFLTKKWHLGPIDENE